MKAVPRPANGHHYTSAEIVQILERAKALGVTFLKVEGFEATWGLELPPKVDQTKPAPLEMNGPPLAHQKGWEPRPTTQPEGPRRAANLCNVCGAEKIMGKYGRPYCVQCYVDKKERGGR